MNAKKTKATPAEPVEVREIWPAGTEVKIKNLALNGIVNAVILAPEGVTYRITYWSAGDIKVVDLNEFEFSTTSTKRPFGFKTKVHT